MPPVHAHQRQHAVEQSLSRSDTETLLSPSRDHFGLPVASNGGGSAGKPHLHQRSSSNAGSQSWSSPCGKKRNSWPPSPLVEDEAASVAKEQDPPTPIDSDVDDDAPSRGSIDQQPILLDADADASADDSTPTDDHAQEHHLNPRHSAGTSSPTSRRSVKFADVDHVRLFRKSATDKAQPDKSDRQVPTLSAVDTSRRNPSLHNHIPPSSDSPRSSISRDSSSREASSVGRDASRPTALRGEGRPRENRPERPDPLTPAKDIPKHARDAPSIPSRRREYRSDEIPNGGSAPGMERERPRSSLASRTERLRSDLGYDPMATPPSQVSPSTDYFGSGKPAIPGTYGGQSTRLPPSPPRSPRHSWNAPPSPVASRTGSRNNSRAPSPHQPETSTAASPLSRTSSSTRVLDARASKASKLALAISVPEVAPRSSVRGHVLPTEQQVSTPLPYPVDDAVVMPSEELHMPKAERLSGSIPSLVSRVNMLKEEALGSAAVDSTSTRPTRPGLTKRHTHAGDLPTVRAFSANDAGVDIARLPAQDSLPSAKFRNPPSCPRSEAARGYDDWYTLKDAPNMNVCPDCFKSTFADTSFERYFSRVAQGTNVRIRCDFASSWMRLAWRLTHLEQRRDLVLLQQLARLHAAGHQCPGEKDSLLQWHAVSDKRGRQLKHFDVCPADVRRIQILMPIMSGILEPSERSAGHKRQCDLHEKSPRHDAYLERLAEVYEEAHLQRRKADVERFVELARRKTELRECERGRVIENGQWYFIPELPAFTVCEDCHHSLIVPAHERGSQIAAWFNRTAKYVRDDKPRDARKDEAAAASCQLWSPRMRRVLKRATDRNDYEYLEQRAVERKLVEDGYHMRRNALKRDLRRESGHDAQSVQAVAELEEKLEDEERYWRKWQ